MASNLFTFTKNILFRVDTFLPPRSSFKRGDGMLFITWFFIIFTVFAGSVRKWITGPGAVGNLIFLGQLLLPFIFYFVLSARKAYPRFTTPAMFSVYVVYLVVAAINPKNNTIYHGIFGIVIHLGFWISWLAYYRNRRTFEIEKFVKLFIVILLVEVMLGSLQYTLPGNHFLNRFATGEENNNFVGNALRVAGTFSYLGGFQAWVTFNGFFIWFLIVRRYPSFVILAVFSLSLYAGLISGARGAVGLFLLTSLFAFVHSGFFFKNFFYLIANIALFVMAIYFFGGNLVRKFEEASNNFQERVDQLNGSNELESRIIGSYEEIFPARALYPIYGIGLGSTYQGANKLFGESTYSKEYGYYEGELGRIVLEGGYLLLFLRVVLFLVMMRYSYMPTLGKIYLFIVFVNSMIVFNTYLGFFFMLGIAFIDRAYYLEHREKSKKPTVSQPVHVPRKLLTQD